ncbi:superoxide dismutase [Actinoplanes sp. NEAU-A12]|uniref:Superoxide dismutase n=1 Tax=Actinoplanes sandaracinus TaxID=3045177 RepID=A0ABT6X197_9ACTN|nr:superoxide dismutase [Actinoplanes sandaracinus]MDI6105775.1 superoxide dismutase [Actinoplanes sandaracinus]
MKTRLLAIVAPLMLTAAAPAPAASPGADSEGTFKTWRTGARAVTYDTAAVPAGARARVMITKTDDGVRVSLLATGLKPDRAYGAHLHTSPCGKDPAAAGPHYQHRLDPAAGPGKPSVDPAYANPDNEVWLDFVTNTHGVGRVRARQDWNLDESRQPWSLVLHAEHTHTTPGVAGTAGARLACLTRDTVTR